MDEHIRKVAEETARLVLQRYSDAFEQENSNSTPVDAIVGWLGLGVETFHRDNRPQGTYGYVDPDEENIIWLVHGLPEPLRRFTLAHELGHVLLHCEPTADIQALLGTKAVLHTLQISPASSTLPLPSLEEPCNEVDLEQDITNRADQALLQERLGIGQSYDPRSQREQAANIFAAELLMPFARIRTLYLEERVPPQSLLSTFGVSSAALLNRLAELFTQPRSVEAQKTEEKAPIQKRSTTYDIFQQKAIEAATPALIVAGPGSGKTSTLIGRVEYMVHTLKIPPQQILALTFSRKAAQEMEERLQSVLTRTTEALPTVSTFHAFCAEVLRDYGTLVGLRPDFSLIDEAEGYFLLRQHANQMDLRHYQQLHDPTHYFPDMLKAISRAKDELVSPEQYMKLAQAMLHKAQEAQDEEATQQAQKSIEVAQVYALYQDALQRRGDADFGGLLMLTTQLLTEHTDVQHELQQHYTHILVDEFQDVNRASGVLLRVLAGEARRVWVVGDANQAIYGFRGASPANITRFEHDFPGAVVLPLSRNYRSRPDLVRIAESFRCQQLELGQEPGKNEPVRLALDTASVTIAKATDERAELEGLKKDIQNKHAQGYNFNDMIILCRTRSHVQKISRALADAGLPVVERGSMFEQEHIKDVVSLLLLFTDTGGSGLLRLARQNEHPIEQSDLEALFLAAHRQKTSPVALLYHGDIATEISTQGRESLLRLSNIYHDLQQQTSIWGLLAQYLFIETAILRDAFDASTSSDLADYNALLQMARHFDTQYERLNENTVPYEQQRSLDQRIRGFLEYLSLLVLMRQDGAQRQQEDGENNSLPTDMLRVMTVHASKGLEFPVVYMPGLAQLRFPTIARSSAINAPTGMLVEEIEQSKSKAHESGESCLFYVGVTRAKEAIVLSYSERYGKRNHKRSPYLDALEAGLPEERVTKIQWNETTNAEQEDYVQALSETTPSLEFARAMKPTVLHASAIEKYIQCPRRYAYDSLYHFGNQDDSYLLFWKATQKTAEALNEQNKGLHEHVPSTGEARALYTKHWQELGGQNAPFATFYERHGHEVADSMQRDLSSRGNVSWEMRSLYNVEVDGKTVQVTIDRIDTEVQEESQAVENPAQITPLPSFKRTRFGKRKEKPAAETRELFYLLAYRQHFPTSTPQLLSHNMSTGESQPISMTSKKERSLYEEATQAMQAMERDEYPAQPAEPYRCPTCPFFLICPA